MKVKLPLIFSFVFILFLFTPSPSFATFPTTPAKVSPLNQQNRFQTDLFTGSASYKYDLKLPKGRNELAPDVSLDYNSLGVRNISSQDGMGWEINRDYIERDVNFTPTTTSDDKFKLHFKGETYDLVYVASDNRYHTKTESFLNIEKIASASANSSGEYWLVKDTNGTKYRFGYGTNAELMCQGRSFVKEWNLDQIEDTHGNQVYYTYTEDNGISYLNKIEYNNEKKRIVQFNYDSNPYQRTLYPSGCEINETNRLSNIQVKIDNSLVREYSASYSAATNTQPLLSSLTETGSDGSSLPATRFAYNSEVQSWNSSYIDWVNSASFDADLSESQVKIVDVTGDGLPDVIESEMILGNTYIYVFRNTGTAFSTSRETWLNNFNVDLRLDQANVRLIDVTGDGLPDLVRSVNNGGADNTWTVYRNTGTSWSTSGETWASGTFDNNLASSNVTLADANGDGLPDVIRSINWSAGNDQWLVYKNTGSSWSTSDESWASGMNVNLDSTYATMADANGDGLIDIVNCIDHGGANKEWQVYLNTGSTWNTAVTWASSIDACLNGTNTALIDVNGDSLPDVVNTYNHGGADNEWSVYLNQGNSWSTTRVEWIRPVEANIEENNSTLADVNGDGLVDLVKTKDSGDRWRVWLNNGNAPHLMSTITTAQGGTISFAYDPSTKFDNTGDDSLSDLPFPMWVVDTQTVSNGMNGAHQTTDVTTYTYLDGLYDWQDREFRGFKEINTSEPNTAKKKYVFNQDDSLKGLLAEVQTRDSSDNPYAESENTWSSSQSNGVTTVKLDTEKQYTYDGNASNPKIIETQYQYDSYGNITKKSELGDTSTTGDERFTYNEYTANTADWIVNTPKHTYLNAADDATKVSEGWFYYDGNTGLSDTPTKGDLTKEVKWLSGGTNPVTLYEYDSYGNQTKVTDANNHSTQTYFGTTDTTYTYPDKTKNAKNQETYTVYDLGTGNLLSQTDSNGSTTSYEYDVFGRLLKEIKPYDSTTYPTVNYTYAFDGIAPESILVSKREVSSASGTLDVYTILDGLNRKIQTRTDAEDTSKQIVADTFYDPTGEVQKETVPYLSTSSALTPTPTPTPQFSLNDKTVNGNNLTNNNNAAVVTSSLPFTASSHAVDFVGSSSQYLSVADNTAWKPTGNFTVEFWMKTTSTEQYVAQSQSFVGSKTSGWFFYNAGSKIRFYSGKKTGTTQGTDYQYVESTSTINDGVWHHIAGVYDGTNLKIYVDGVNEANTPWTYAPAYESTNYPAIGTRINLGTPEVFYTGKIDEFRIWSVARSATQINNNKSVELVGSDLNLAAYYPFETYSNPTTTDSTYTDPDPLAKYTEYTYDPLGRVSIITNPKGDDKTIAYDHWKETTIDENGHIKRKYLNAFNKITKVDEVLNNVTIDTEYTYDPLDNLTQVTDAPGNETTFTYDTLGRKITQVDPDMGTWHYGYDGVGNLTSQTDNRNVTITKTYDELNRLTKTDYPTNADTTFLYDQGKIGTLSIATDAAGMVSYLYDNRLRKTQEQRSINGTTKTTQFSYDPLDRLTTQINPDGEAVTYTFNSQGEIDSASGSAALLNNINYNSQGKITSKVFANGLTTNYTYNTDDFRLNRIQTGSLQDLNYTYDGVGNINSITDNVSDKTQAFTYDDLDRLKTASESGGFNYAYTYNSIGNITDFTNNGEETNYLYGQNAGIHALTTASESASTAVTLVNLTTLSSASSAASYTTSAIFPSSNKLELLTVASRTGISTNPNQPTVTGNGLTWVAVNSVVYDDTSTSRRRVTLFRAMGASPTSGALTISFNGQTQTSFDAVVDEASGIDTSGTNGSGAIVQNVTNSDDSGTATLLTATLSAFSNVGNATYGAFATGNASGSTTAGSSFSKLGEVADGGSHAGDNQVTTEWLNANATSVGMSWSTGGELGGIAIEIKVSSGEGTNSPQATYTYDANGNMTSDGTNCYQYNEANELDKVSRCSDSQTIAEYVYDYNGNRMVKRNFTSGTLANTITSWSDSYETKVTAGSTQVSGSNVTSGGATGSITSQSTASITPSANNLILLSVMSRTANSTQPNTPTVTGNGLTWVQVATKYYDTDSSSRKKITVFRAMGASPSTGAATIDFGGQTQTDVIWSVDQFSGVDTSGTNGSSAVVQSATASDEVSGGGTLTITLGAFANSNNATFGVLTGDNNVNVPAAGSGFTALVASKTLPSGGSQQEFISEWRNSNSTSVPATFSTAVGMKLGGIALEIKADSGSGTTETATYYFANGELIAKKDNSGTRTYFQNNHLGSTALVTNQAGTVVENTTYDPWGEVLSGGTSSKYLYTGQEKDSETGLSYYNARYYNSNIRRFAQPDNIIQDVYNPQDLNRYSYTLNNPLRYTDPTGHCIGPLILACGAVAIAAPVIVANINPIIAYISQAFDSVRKNPTPTNIALTAADVGSSLLPETKIGGTIVTKTAGKVLPKVETAVKDSKPVAEVFKASNFRQNLGKITGGVQEGADAHHVFPQKFRSTFEEQGLNIDDPIYGSWWEASDHRKNAYKYNLEWEEHLASEQKKGTLDFNSILNFGKKQSAIYDIDINY